MHLEKKRFLTNGRNKGADVNQNETHKKLQLNIMRKEDKNRANSKG